LYTAYSNYSLDFPEFVYRPVFTRNSDLQGNGGGVEDKKKTINGKKAGADELVTVWVGAGINYFETPNIDQFHFIFHFFFILGLAWLIVVLVYLLVRGMAMRVYSVFFGTFFYSSVIFSFLFLFCACNVWSVDLILLRDAEQIRQIELKLLISDLYEAVCYCFLV
jgi:hypothetical protein